MSYAESTPVDVFDGEYWYPAIVDGVLSEFDPLDKPDFSNGTINLATLAQDLAKYEHMPEGRAVKLGAAQEICAGRPINLDGLVLNSLIRFRRESIIIAGHPLRESASLMVGLNTLGETGLVASRYQRQIENRPEVGMHWLYQYEAQYGHGIILPNGRGQPKTFGLKAFKNRVANDAQLDKFNIPIYTNDNVTETTGYDIRPLHLPASNPCIVGQAMSADILSPTMLDQQAHLTRIERVNYLEVLISKGFK